MTSTDDAREAREEIIETQRILDAYERAERRSEKKKLSEDAYIEAMHSRLDLTWVYDDDAIATKELMKAVEKLMSAVHSGWAYHSHPVVSSAEKAAIDMTDQALRYIDAYLEATDERP